ncbi:hypothetical protein Dsin_007071 [Dipteronia sinensis]|uniref:Transposase MuDR plant domain-containing protein n=1 Tax=Dipteronia sinensis TaxID=43782 RepID=A0AAE0B163_9ROSI|nr:hypothetical protein Dsin_007071 [Dipteronia sinensis]
MGSSLSFAQGVKPTITIHTTDEETSQESDSNDRDGAIGCEGTPPEFETNTDHGLDNLNEQYLLTEDESFVDFIVDEDNRAGVNCGSPNFKVDNGVESDASHHSHSSGHHDDDLVGNTTTQRGSSSLVHRPWSILRSEQYSFQTINHECSSSNSRFYKDIIFSSKKELKRELSLMASKQHFEFRIRRSSKARFQATCKDDNCSFRVHAKKWMRESIGRYEKLTRNTVAPLRVSKVGFGKLILLLLVNWYLQSFGLMEQP